MISGNLGPRGDGYEPGARMSAAEAQAYHAPQIEMFAATEADMVAAFTMNYVEEAVGIVRAAKAAAMPVAISFTTETDGRLPSGATLEEAIGATDEASGGYPAYYMINCAHPTHLEPRPRPAGEVARPDPRPAGQRLPPEPQGAGRESRPRRGEPGRAGAGVSGAAFVLRNLSVVGGCCGTDHRHVAAIARAMQPARALA